MTVDPRPTLVYDGDCGICRYWVTIGGSRPAARRLPALSGGREGFPSIPPAAFPHAVQFIDTDGTCIRALPPPPRAARGSRKECVVVAIRAPAGLRDGSEWAYAFFARRRGLLNFVSQAPLGSRRSSPSATSLCRGCSAPFRRDHVAAFASLAVQIQGLVGHAGILPLADYLDAAHRGARHRRHIGSAYALLGRTRATPR